MLLLVWLFVGISIISDIFMEGIGVITSQSVTVQVTDSLGYQVPKKIQIWNPTVANLTLMALGSSAPEILLNVIETLMNLGTTPGELGPSTIVGSAAFNLLLISAVSIMAIDAESDDRTEPELIEDKTPRGVKKIKDLGVFATTTIFSLFAYIWLYVSLLDGEVDPFEAWFTFALFFIMICMAYGMDKLGQRRLRFEKQKELLQKPGAAAAIDVDAAPEKGSVTTYTPLEFYNALIPVESGQKVADEAEKAKLDEMRGFLKHHFNTDKVQNVDINELKQKINGESVIARLKYRAPSGHPSKKSLGKHEVYRFESNHSKHLSQEHKHDSFGFNCLNFAVSESSGFIKLKVHNKKKATCEVGVRTVVIPDGAQPDKDFLPIDETVSFKNNEWGEVQIKIIDDEQWEPDKEFAVELYDVSTKEALPQKDTRCVVLILDDDKPGFLSFGEGKKANIKHVATEEKCVVRVQRSKGSDGKISCKYKTVQVSQAAGRFGTPGEDYEHTEGVLHFEHNETEKEIVIPII